MTLPPVVWVGSLNEGRFLDRVKLLKNLAVVEAPKLNHAPFGLLIPKNSGNPKNRVGLCCGASQRVRQTYIKSCPHRAREGSSPVQTANFGFLDARDAKLVQLGGLCEFDLMLSNPPYGNGSKDTTDLRPACPAKVVE